MNTQGLLIIALVTGILFFATVAANLEQFPKVSYQDIEQLNATCPGADNCKEERYFDNLDFYNCNCEEFCRQYDTCCVDSQYRDKLRKISDGKPYNCVKPYRSKTPYFMIDSCDPSWLGDNHTGEMCSANVEELDDLFLAVPVTNNESGVTYSNYYCAVCNGETDKVKLTFWDLSLKSKAGDIMTSPLPKIHFLPTRGVWIIGNDTDDIHSVNPTVTITNEIEDVVHDCVSNVISLCASDWNDTIIEEKCASYMAVVRLRRSFQDFKTYRNVHCAVCNHESFEKVSCTGRKTIQTVVRNTFFVRLFSLNDKENNCNDDEVYDPISKKCRKMCRG